MNYCYSLFDRIHHFPIDVNPFNLIAELISLNLSVLFSLNDKRTMKYGQKKIMEATKFSTIDFF